MSWPVIGVSSKSRLQIQYERKDKDRGNFRSGVTEKFRDGTIEKILFLASEKVLSYRGVVDYPKENPAI